MPDPSLLRGENRVICLDHPNWIGAKLRFYEGTVVGRKDGLYEIKFPFLARTTFLPGRCLSPVYNDCEVCGYAAWNERFCGWHLDSEDDPQ